MARKTLLILGAMLSLAWLAPGLNAGDVTVLSVGYDVNPGHPVDTACKYWQKLVEEKSGGSLRLELYPSSQLGRVVDILDQALAGDNTCVLTSAGYFTNLGVKDCDVTQAPFLIESWDGFAKVLGSDWWAGKEREIEGKGLKIISNNWHYGVRHLLSKKPILSVDDLQGVKIRVPADNSIQAWQSFGAAPVAMSLGEAYMAMQQGTIDAIENPFSVLHDGSFYEVAKNLTLTAHKYDMTQFTCGKQFFDSLTGEQQEILLSTGREAADYFNSIIEDVDAGLFEKLKKKGVVVHTLTPGQRQTFLDKSNAYFDAPGSLWPKEIRQTITDIIGK